MEDAICGGVVGVPLAQTGEGIAECELLRWHVEEVSLLELFHGIYICCNTMRFFPFLLFFFLIACNNDFTKAIVQLRSPYSVVFFCGRTTVAEVFVFGLFRGIKLKSFNHFVKFRVTKQQ